MSAALAGVRVSINGESAELVACSIELAGGYGIEVTDDDDFAQATRGWNRSATAARCTFAGNKKGATSCSSGGRLELRDCKGQGV
jgi:hypothetical protein